MGFVGNQGMVAVIKTTSISSYLRKKRIFSVLLGGVFIKDSVAFVAIYGFRGRLSLCLFPTDNQSMLNGRQKNQKFMFSLKIQLFFHGKPHKYVKNRLTERSLF